MQFQRPMKRLEKDSKRLGSEKYFKKFVPYTLVPMRSRGFTVILQGVLVSKNWESLNRRSYRRFLSQIKPSYILKCHI